MKKYFAALAIAISPFSAFSSQSVSPGEELLPFLQADQGPIPMVGSRMQYRAETGQCMSGFSADRNVDFYDSSAWGKHSSSFSDIVSVRRWPTRDVLSDLKKIVLHQAADKAVKECEIQNEKICKVNSVQFVYFCSKVFSVEAQALAVAIPAAGACHIVKTSGVIYNGVGANRLSTYQSFYQVKFGSDYARGQNDLLEILETNNSLRPNLIYMKPLMKEDDRITFYSLQSAESFLKGSQKHGPCTRLTAMEEVEMHFNWETQSVVDGKKVDPIKLLQEEQLRKANEPKKWIVVPPTKVIGTKKPLLILEIQQ